MPGELPLLRGAVGGMTDQPSLFDPGPPAGSVWQLALFETGPPTATVRDLLPKDCVYRHDHEPGGPTTYQCFSRSQLGTATEKITEGEGERLDAGIYRFGWPVADVAAHTCSCGNWQPCWHLAAALLRESGLRPNPQVVEVGRRYRQARYDRVEADLRKRLGEGLGDEVEEWLQGQAEGGGTP